MTRVQVLGIRVLAICIVAIIAAASAAPATAQVLKREPPMGALREGQRVLVDDGSCPQGRIMEVIGGNHIKAGGSKNIERIRRCIARK